MPKIVPIVEGEGEVEAVPILIRKLLTEMERWDIQIAKPKNAIGCGNLTKPNGLERFVRLAWMEPDCAAVLILMDADKQCPMQLAEEFSRRIQAIGAKHTCVITIAKCEYEAWFLASLETIAGNDLQGRPGLPAGLIYPDNVEEITAVKGWLSRHFPSSRIYKETEDQAPMTHFLDIELAKSRSRSFRRFCHAIEQAVGSFDNQSPIVTPDFADTAI